MMNKTQKIWALSAAAGLTVAAGSWVGVQGSFAQSDLMEETVQDYQEDGVVDGQSGQSQDQAQGQSQEGQDQNRRQRRMQNRDGQGQGQDGRQREGRRNRGGQMAGGMTAGGDPGAALQTTDVSMMQAKAIIESAVQKAMEIDTKMDIAVVDAGGNLKAFVRMDGAWLGSIDIAIKKAKTARSFDMNTGDIGELSQPGGPLYNIEHSNGGLITFPGGVPLKDAEGNIIGAVGVSGSTVENDHEVAMAGAEAIR